MSRYTSTLRVRLEPKMNRAIARRARAELVSTSEVARRAFAAYLKQPAAAPAKPPGA